MVDHERASAGPLAGCHPFVLRARHGLAGGVLTAAERCTPPDRPNGCARAVAAGGAVGVAGPDGRGQGRGGAEKRDYVPRGEGRCERLNGASGGGEGLWLEGGRRARTLRAFP
jgi:hypothetical protein